MPAWRKVYNAVEIRLPDLGMCCRTNDSSSVTLQTVLRIRSPTVTWKTRYSLYSSSCCSTDLRLRGHPMSM